VPKFLLFSDIHVHPHKKSQSRLDDCLKALEWVFETAKKEKVDYVLFGGDLLHDRQKIDTLTYVKVYNVLKNYEKENFKTYLVVGNHDMWFANDWSVTSVRPFGSINNFEVIAETKNLNLKGINWFFLPYTHDPISELAKCTTDVSDTYLLGHLSIDGAKLNSAGSRADVAVEHDGDMVKISKDLFLKFKTSFFGHYHSHQKLAKNVMYIGSPLQLSYGEAGDDKFILVLDTDEDDLKYIKNTFSPVHLYLKQDELSQINKDDLEGNFVTLLSDGTDDKNLKKNMELINESGASTVQVKKVSKVADEHAIQDAKALLASEDKLLERYVEQIQDLQLNKQQLIKVGQSIMNYQPEE
jgi:DNA repair exonuclease SbcCD nuclease subunit